MNDKCVYFHINPNRQEIFYVGIGNNKRPYLKSNRSSQWKRYTKKHDYQVIIIHSGLTVAEAYEFEIKYIAQVGRRDKELGPLINKTDGGEGGCNVIISEATRDKLRYKKSDAHILKLSDNLKNYWNNMKSLGIKRKRKPLSEEHKAKLSKLLGNRPFKPRKPRSEETKNKIRLANTNRVVSEETKTKQSLSAKNRNKRSPT